MNNYIKLPFTLTIAGSCGVGKSYTVKYLVESFQVSEPFDAIFVFSNTGNFTQDYEFLKNFPELRSNIFNSLETDEKIKQIMNIQQMNRQRNVRRQVLIILDDVMGSIKDSKIFKQLVSTYRHYNISVIFSIQYINATASYLREISQYVIIFNQNTLVAKKLTYENYFSDAFEKFNDFKEYMRKLQKYQFFFIDRSKNSKTIMKCPS